MFTAKIHKYAPELTELYKNGVLIQKGFNYLEQSNLKGLLKAYRYKNRPRTWEGSNKFYSVVYNYENLKNQTKLFCNLDQFKAWLIDQRKPARLIVGFDANNKAIYETKKPNFEITKLKTIY